MADKRTRRRTYDVPPAILIGACQAALARIRANIEQQDIERGTIVATIGAGALAPVSELALEIRPEGEGRASLEVTWRARKLGGDKAILRSFLDAVDSLARMK
jgi:hypothetical protein